MLVTTYDRRREMHAAAERLFEQTWLKGQIKRFFIELMGNQHNLLFLSDIEDEPTRIEKLAYQEIDIDRIRGTEGRNDRFDLDLNPVMRRNKVRWVSVATGIMDDVTQIPPIDVIQINDVYYIQDGHHRVSASKALGKITISANVIRWHFD